METTSSKAGPVTYAVAYAFMALFGLILTWQGLRLSGEVFRGGFKSLPSGEDAGWVLLFFALGLRNRS